MTVKPLQRILVVDDEPDILAVIRTTLRARGDFEVEVCACGQDALEVAPRFAPDLILLDVMMPGIDGPMTLKALQEDPQTSSTPVVFMTAKVMPQETARYLTLGAVAVIAKPFDQRTLVDEIEVIWGGQVSTRSAWTPNPEMEALLESYTRALPEKIAEIASSWRAVEDAQGNAELAQKVHSLVHRLAGTAGTYGYSTLGNAASQLEEAVKTYLRTGAQLTCERRDRMRALIDALEETIREPDPKRAR
jgi:CheY-like chemotaxis protein